MVNVNIVFVFKVSVLLTKHVILAVALLAGSNEFWPSTVVTTNSYSLTSDSLSKRLAVLIAPVVSILKLLLSDKSVYVICGTESASAACRKV